MGAAPLSTPEPTSHAPKAGRRWRRAGIFLGGFFLGAAGLVALLLTPPVQGWLLKRLVSSRAGWSIAFEKFGVGPTGLDVRGLEFAMPGVQARSAPIAIRVAPGQLLNQREVRIERVEAHKLLVTLTPADLPPGGAPTPFAGLMPLLRSPLGWALDDAQLDGEIAVREGGASVVIGAFQINGGGVSARTPGEFTYVIAVRSSLLPAGPDNKVRSRGVVRLTQDANHGIERITVEGDLTLPRYGGLALPAGKFSLSISGAGTGEDYRAHFELGSAAILDAAARLDAPRSALSGRVTLQANQSIAASLADGKLPTATIAGSADFTLDLKRSDLVATLAGDLDARDWSRLAPQLAAIDAFKGRLAAVVTRRAGAFAVQQFSALLQGEKTPAAVRIALTQPVDPLALPATAFATLAVEQCPLTWANPWLAPAQVALEPAAFGGAWNIGVIAGRGLQLVPARRFEAGPLVVRGASLPVLPSFKFGFSPRLEVSLEGAALRIDDLTVATAQGDRVSATLDASCDFKSRRVHTAGTLGGTVPTLLSGPEEPLPFALAARWDLALTGPQLQVDTLELTARQDPGTPPYLALRLLRPWTLDVTNLAAPAAAAGDWARVTFDRLPLGWISRWLRDRRFGGTLAAGESVLRSSGTGGLTVVTPTPWQIAGASFGVGGRTLLEGNLSVTPGFALEGGRTQAQFESIDITDAAGNRIRGRITAEARLEDKRGSTAIELDGEFPRLPHSAETFGALHARLRATSHNESAKIAAVDTFELRVSNPERELLALTAPQPFLFGLSNSGMVTVATLAPVRFSLGEIPLAWTRPWLPGIELDGTLQPCDFALTAQFTKFLLRPHRPVNIRQFAARIGGREVAHDTEFSVSPGLDLTCICIPVPAFQLAYSGNAQLTEGAIDVAGRRAIDVDAALSFLGNDQTLLPRGLELTARADFTELSRIPALARSGTPAAGTLVARINGDVLGQAPLEFWSRIDGVPGESAGQVLPALEFFANGRVSLDKTLAAGVEVRLATVPRPSDAKFDVKLALGTGNLEVASAFRSAFFDVAAALACAEAFQPKSATEARPAATAPVATAGRPLPVYRQLGVPFWSALRGHFDLDLGTVQFAPYRIDHVGGRLDLRDRELVLSDLKGEMFAGRWSGDVRIDYQPEDKTADHALAGSFTIEQFDSARVVQTAFPTQLASIDARIDVHSTVHSRGNALFDLLARTEADFTVEGRQGLVRLTVPKQEMAATAAVFGGTLLLSPELRALGRLMKKFAEMPVEQLRITGARTAAGEVQLNEFRVDSPQARLLAHGKISAGENQPLMNRPLELSIDLAAKDEMAVILGGMSLIEKRPRADGYRALKEKFELRGRAGEPDTRPLYDLLAKAVVGSKGTWGFLMRKIQDQVNKMKSTPPTHAAASAAPAP